MRTLLLFCSILLCCSFNLSTKNKYYVLARYTIKDNKNGYCDITKMAVEQEMELEGTKDFLTRELMKKVKEQFPEGQYSYHEVELVPEGEYVVVFTYVKDHKSIAKCTPEGVGWVTGTTKEKALESYEKKKKNYPGAYTKYEYHVWPK